MAILSSVGQRRRTVHPIRDSAMVLVLVLMSMLMLVSVVVLALVRLRGPTIRRSEVTGWNPKPTKAHRILRAGKPG
jgi:hypothetical protein